MPTYEYSCEKCGGEFELRQSMKDDALSVCPKDKCLKARWGKGRVKRAIGTGAGLIFKGDGFYTTDYRSEGYKESAKNDKPPTETKPAETKTTETKSSDSKVAPAKADSKKPKTEAKSPTKTG